MKPREVILSSGTKVFLGRDETNNDELMKSFKGKENIILHTVAPGSPFCVIEKLNPTKEEIYEAGVVTSSKSQDWRNNKRDIKMHVFSGKDLKKPFFAKAGSWTIKGTPKTVIIKRKDISRFSKR